MEGEEAAMAVSEGIERAESRNAKPLRTQSTRRKASAIAALSVVNGHPGGAVIRGLAESIIGSKKSFQLVRCSFLRV